MSSTNVIAATSRLLRSMLVDAFRADFPEENIEAENIALEHPSTDVLRDEGTRLSLWLYRIEENEFVKNQPLRRSRDSESELLRPPLALDLSYLVTPNSPSAAGGGTAERDQRYLGIVMRAFYENAVVDLTSDGNGDGVHEKLKIILGRISLEELTRIWEALNEPYRLSVCYRVRVVGIDSMRRLAVAPIADSRRGYGARDRSNEEPDL